MINFLTLQTKISRCILQHARVITERTFCDGLEVKLTSSLGTGVQQAGAPETAVKSVTPCFYLELVSTRG